ncbi:MAG: MFS transporter [Bacteroidota bacterium]
MTSQHHYPLACPTGRLTITATILASAMAFIDGTALNVILPSLQANLDATASELFWVLNSYLLMLAALIIIGGSLGDKIGRVKVFKYGIAIFTIGSLLCGIAANIHQLIIFRGLQGIGGALMIPGSLAIISATFSPEEKGKAIGVWSSVTTVVTICGPVLGGALADLGLWRMIFFLNLPLGVFAFWVSHVKVPESFQEGSGKIDWVGAVLLASSLTALTYGFLEVPERGTSDIIVIINLALGVVLLVVFLLSQKGRVDAMVPFSLFANRTFTGVNLLSFFLYAGLGGMMLFLSLNLIQIQGYSQFQAGLTFLPFSLLMVVIAPRAGKLTDQYGARNFLIFGPLITAIGFFMLSTIGMTAGPSQYWSTFFPGFIVFALGMSITVVPLTTAVMTSADESQSGIASGINNSVTRIASTFMNAIAGALAIFLFAQLISESPLFINSSLEVQGSILIETNKLGDAQVPSSMVADNAGELNRLFQTSFLEVYSTIGWICCGLALLSSAIAVLTVPSKNHLTSSIDVPESI